MSETLFERISTFAVRRPRAVLAAALLTMIAAVAVAAVHLGLKTSNLDLIDADLPTVRAFRAFADEFGTPNVLVVVFEGPDERRLGRAVNEVGPRLHDLPGVRAVIDRLPYDEQTVRDLDLDPYIASRDRGMFFIFVQPDDPHSSAETIEPFVTAVRSAIDASGVEADGVRVGLTGMPRYALDDRDVIRDDISRLSIGSGALVLLLFVAAFRAPRRPLAAVAALIVAIVITVGCVALWPGHLTLLSAFFASILFGLGIDFGIHLVGRVEELRAAGLDEVEAIPRAVRSIGRGLAAAAVTTACVFLAMVPAGFLGFAELGFVAGIGVLLCLVTTLTVLPALLVVIRPRGRTSDRSGRSRIARVLLALHGHGVAWLVAAAAILAPLYGSPAFDTDYLDLQPADSEAVRLEREMVRRSDLSPQFAAFVVGSEDDARKLADRLMGDETVGEVRSIADLQPPFPGAPVAPPPREFVEAFRSAVGHHAVYAYPAQDIWDPVEQQRFLEHMRAIDPAVTGMPFLGSFMMERSRRAMRITAALGATILLISVWLAFRNVGLTVLAVAPTFLTATSMLALMKLFGIDFNPLNVMALPVVLGIAVDDGVHVVHRFVSENGDIARTLAGTGRAVVLTSLTTLAAFGTLAFTSHRGLASFALALSIGVGSALVLSVLVLPALLERLGGRVLAGATSRSRPATAEVR